MSIAEVTSCGARGESLRTTLTYNIELIIGLNYGKDIIISPRYMGKARDLRASTVN
jgi:hypothetical protein